MTPGNSIKEKNKTEESFKKEGMINSIKCIQRTPKDNCLFDHVKSLVTLARAMLLE